MTGTEGTHCHRALRVPFWLDLRLEKPKHAHSFAHLSAYLHSVGGLASYVSLLVVSVRICSFPFTIMSVPAEVLALYSQYDFAPTKFTKLGLRRGSPLVPSWNG